MTRVGQQYCSSARGTCPQLDTMLYYLGVFLLLLGSGLAQVLPFTIDGTLEAYA